MFYYKYFKLYHDNRFYSTFIKNYFYCYARLHKYTKLIGIFYLSNTGIKGVGGLQTRGKYRTGYPKSQYVK